MHRRMENTTALERSALIVATLTSFMGPFMISAVNVALPVIQREMDIGAVTLSWISTAYLLAVAVFLVPIGKLADIYGRKKIFTIGLFIYTAASTLTVFVPTIFWFIVMRVFQGCGSAMFITTGMAILTSVFPPQKRGRVIGIYVAAVYIGLSAGPFVGGIMTQHLGWRSLFLAMLPLGAGSIYATQQFLKGEWADARGERFDWPGSLIYGCAILSLVYGATLLPRVIAIYLVLGGSMALIAFIWLESKTDQPVFEVHLFRNNRIFAFSSLAALINYSATFAVTFLMSLYLQYIKGLPPQAAGTVLVVQPLMMALFSPVAGRLSDRLEPRIIASIGMALTASGLVLFIFLETETGLGFILLNLILLGLGFALFSSPNMSAIMGAVEKRFYGIASGTMATMRLLGQMTSMALATLFLSIFLGREPIHPGNFPQFLQSTRFCFQISAVLCGFGIFFSLFRGKLRL